MSEKGTFEVGTEVVAIRDVDQALFGNYRATISKGDRGVVVSIGNRLLVKWGAGKQLYIGAADVEPADPGLPSPLAPAATDELQRALAAVDEAKAGVAMARGLDWQATALSVLADELEAQNAAQQQRIEELEKALRRALIIMCEEPQGEWRFVKSNQRPPSWDRLIRATDVVADVLHTDEKGA